MAVNIGDTYGYLEVISLNNSHRRGNSWICRCTCGKEIKVDQGDLVGQKRKKKSCGCKKKKQHGYSVKYPDLYFKWSDIRTRCYKDTQESKIYYKDRGITVCDEWKDDFQEFLSWSLENGYKKGLSLDRIDCDGNYEPANCRWTTKMVQAQNRGMHKNNTSGAKGVRRTNNGRFHAYITREFKQYNLGMYKTFDEAVQARKNAEGHYELFRTLEDYKPNWKRLRRKSLGRKE